jgi:hypothetical protein
MKLYNRCFTFYKTYQHEVSVNIAENDYGSLGSNANITNIMNKQLCSTEQTVCKYFYSFVFIYNFLLFYYYYILYYFYYIVILYELRYFNFIIVVYILYFLYYYIILFYFHYHITLILLLYYILYYLFLYIIQIMQF